MSEITKLYAHRWESPGGDCVRSGGIVVCDAPDYAEELNTLMWVEMEPEEMENLAVHLLVTAAKIKEAHDV